MPKETPSIMQFMTPNPYSIGDEQAIATASDLMAKHEIRHLPVLHGGELVGIISDRDIRIIESLPGIELVDVKVKDAMSGDPFTATPNSPLDEVAAEMAVRRFGACIVVDGSRVVGIFTSVDACGVLATQLRERFDKR